MGNLSGSTWNTYPEPLRFLFGVPLPQALGIANGDPFVVLAVEDRVADLHLSFVGVDGEDFGTAPLLVFRVQGLDDGSDGDLLGPRKLHHPRDNVIGECL